MDKSNRTKAKQLGMPYGTAKAKLVKALMFKMAKRLNEDICFQCKEPILTIRELSIEHKIPWLHGDNKLFWDLDNIAFSHLSCNTRSCRHTSWAERRTIKCGGCQKEFSILLNTLNYRLQRMKQNKLYCTRECYKKHCNQLSVGSSEEERRSWAPEAEIS